VDRADAINSLPPSYQRVLLLVASGRSEDEIARQLDLDGSAVRPLVDLAEAKLARLTDTSPERGINGGKEER
jgi:DNA-directed RNA polymerase specialized sigma24 family protein